MQATATHIEPSDADAPDSARLITGETASFPVVAPVTPINPATEARTIPNPARAVKDDAIGSYHLAIIAPALAHPRKSKARRAWVETQAALAHLNPVTGKVEQFVAATLYKWISIAEGESGADGLRPVHAARARHQVLISRAWDKACPLPDAVQRVIASRVAMHVRGLWRNDVDGCRNVAAMASTWLVQFCRENGWPSATARQCKVTRAFVERAENKAAQMLGIKERDAKTYHDRFMPRVVRSREHLWPMELVCVDVHRMDILVARADGSLATPRMIGWLDIATGVLVHYTIKLCERHEDVKQTDVSLSFAELVTTWGLPGRVQEDNGSENRYIGFRLGYAALRALAGIGITQSAPFMTAIPNSPTSKLIEQFWGIIKGQFQAIPGFIGGDRMNKRTHKMGRAPTPFPGPLDEFKEVVAAVIRTYHNTPQRGHLDGLTPNESMEKQQAERHTEQSAYVPSSVTREGCALALGERRKATVRTAGVQVEGVWYYNDAVAAFIGQELEISYAPWAPECIFVLTSTEDFLIVPRSPILGYDDPAGAKEQARRASVASARLRLIGKTAPKIDAVAEALRHAAASPPMVQPETAGTISLGRETDRALSAARAEAAAQPAPDVAPLTPLERINPRTGERTRLAPDHFAERKALLAQKQAEQNAAIAAQNRRALGLDPAP